MKRTHVIEALGIGGLVAGLALSQGCRTAYGNGYGEEENLTLRPMPEALAPEAAGDVTYPTKEEDKPLQYWQKAQNDGHGAYDEALGKLKTTAASVSSAASGYTTYTVKSGESLSVIAHRYGLRWQDIAAINPRLNVDKIHAGQTIRLPGTVDTSKAVVRSTTTKAASHSGGNVYVVKSGDILGRIANAHGVKVSELKKANGLTSDKIIVGQKLVIPGAKAATPAPAPAPRTVKVSNPPASPSAGNAPAPAAPAITPPAITPPAVTAPVVEPPAITPPAITPPTVTPPAVTPPAATPAPAIQSTHTVQQGEDLYQIGVKWGVTPAQIKAANGLTSNEVKPGTVLNIPANQ